jgi:hypothetical protein
MLSLSVRTHRTGNGNLLKIYCAKALAVASVTSSASDTSRSRVQKSMAVNWYSWRVSTRQAPRHVKRDEVAGPGDEKRPAIALRLGPPFAGGGPRACGSLPSSRHWAPVWSPGHEEGPEPGGPHVGALPEGEASAPEGVLDRAPGPVRPVGAVQEGLPIATGLGETFVPLVVGLPRDAAALAGERDVPPPLGLRKPGGPLTDLLLWSAHARGHG